MSYFETDWALGKGSEGFIYITNAVFFSVKIYHGLLVVWGLHFTDFTLFYPFIFVCSVTPFTLSISAVTPVRIWCCAGTLTRLGVSKANVQTLLSTISPTKDGRWGGWLCQSGRFPFQWDGLVCTCTKTQAFLLGCTEDCWFCEVKCRKHQRVQGCWRLLNSTHIHFMSPFVG